MGNNLSAPWDNFVDSEIGDWQNFKLGELFKHRQEKNNPDLPLLAVTGKGGVILRNTLERRDTSNADKSRYLTLREGDIAYNTMRMWQGVSGYSEYEGLISPAYTVCEPNKNIDGRFASYLCKLPSLIQVFHRYSQDLVNDTLNLKFENFKRIEIKLPPLHEQKKIATILTSVDTVIEKTQAQIDKLNDLKTGMMQELLTKGIGPDGKPHTEFKDSPVGRIPIWWEVQKLDDLCSWIGVGLASSTTHAYSEYGIPMLRNQNILPNKIRHDDMLNLNPSFAEENASKKIKENDVLTVRTGYPGVSAVVPRRYNGCHSFTTLISRPILEILDSEYLAILINSEYGKRFVLEGAAGGAQQNLNSSTLQNFPVILPTLDEQKLISKKYQLFDAHIDSKKKLLGAYSNTKKALMQDLLTGKVRVTPDPK